MASEDDQTEHAEMRQEILTRSLQDRQDLLLLCATPGAKIFRGPVARRQKLQALGLKRETELRRRRIDERQAIIEDVEEWLISKRG